MSVNTAKAKAITGIAAAALALALGGAAVAPAVAAPVGHSAAATRTLAAKTTTIAKAAKLKTFKAATPAISGTVKVNSTVTVKVGTWTPKPTTFKYQWYANGAAIKGATKSSYKIATSVASKKLTVKVTGSKSGYATLSKTSGAKTVALATLVTGSVNYTATKQTGAKNAHGKYVYGWKLTATHSGTWTSGTSFSYAWKSGGATISTASSIIVPAADWSYTLYVTAKATGYTTVTKTVAVHITYVPPGTTPVQ